MLYSVMAFYEQAPNAHCRTNHPHRSDGFYHAKEKKLFEKKSGLLTEKMVVEGMVGISHLVQGDVRNGIVLLVGRVISPSEMLKNGRLGEFIGGIFGGTGKMVYLCTR